MQDGGLARFKGPGAWDESAPNEHQLIDPSIAPTVSAGTSDGAGVKAILYFYPEHSIPHSAYSSFLFVMEVAEAKSYFFAIRFKSKSYMYKLCFCLSSINLHLLITIRHRQHEVASAARGE